MLDNSAPIPRVSWGFFLGFCAMLLAGSRFWYSMDDVKDRQLKYIDRRDAQHVEQQEEIDALRQENIKLEDKLERLCHQVAIRWQEDICEF